MQGLFILFVFLLGQVIGSFLNCVIYRLEQDKSFLKGRSFCPHCKHVLAWQDLFPVISFIALKGKCRYCGQKISWQYLFVEIAAGILFVLIFTLLDWDFLAFNATMAAFLIIIFVYDLKHYIIPDKVVYPAILTAAVFLFSNSKYNLLINAYSALGAAGFFLLIVLISKGRWMGVGDIKLAFLMGLALGFPNILVALFFAFLTGAIIGTGLIIFKKKGLKSEVPFGPFLVGGTFISLFLGSDIINWYLGLIW